MRLLELACGTSDSDPNEGAGALQVDVVDGRLVVSISAGDQNEVIGLSLQTSSDLQVWTDAEETFDQIEDVLGAQRGFRWVAKAPINGIKWRAVRILARRR